MSFVVVVVDDLSDYQHQLLKGLVEELQPAGTGVVVAIRPPGAEQPVPLGERLITAPDAVGLVVTALTDAAEERRLADLARARGLPVVGVARRLADAPMVGCDNESGMTALMAHLLDECRVRRPVLLAGDSGNVESVQREAVFRRELVLRGVPFAERRRVEGAWHREPARLSMERLLHRSSDVDAVVAINDEMALGAIAALRAAGLVVPGDVLVSGFDDVPAGRAAGLTSVSQDLPGQGRTAAALLGPRRERSVRDVLVPSTLVVRSSTRPGRSSGPVGEPVRRPEPRAPRLRTRLVACATVAEVEEVLADELPKAEIPDAIVRLDDSDVPCGELARLGPCVALQPLGSRGARGLLAYAPGGDDLPLVADVLRWDLSRVLDALAGGVTAGTPRPPSP